MNVGGLQEQNGLIVVSLQDYPMLRCLERYSTNTVWLTMSAQVLQRGLCLEKMDPDSSQRCTLIEEGAMDARCNRRN